ncbi:MAG: ABC transporter ATP-binding protein [Acidimicrobiia bacterium]
MGWGGGGMFGGGGGMGGGGGGMGGGPAANSNQANAASGLPFAGIPLELQAGVEKLTANEPDHGGTPPAFSHRNVDHRPLNLRRMFGAHWPIVMIAGLMVAIEAVTLQAGPFLTRIGIDDGIVKDDWSVIVWTGSLFIVAVLMTIAASNLRLRLTGRLAAEVMYDLRVRVFTHLQRLSLNYYTDEKAGVIMTRMTSDIENLQQLTQDGLVQFAVQGLTMLVVTAILFSYNVELAVITVFIVVPALLALSLWFRSASDKGFMRVRDGIAGVLSDLSESLSGVRVVSSHNRQPRNIVNHRNVVGVYRDANDHTAMLTAVYGPGTEVLGFVAQGLILLIGGRMVQQGELTVGELAGFFLFLNQFFAPIQQLVQLYNTYQQGQSSITKLRELLATEPSVKEADGAIELPAISGEVVLERLAFAYNPALPVLHDVDLRIEAGETVCFVGPTGAGKSTVAKLITRFYDPTAGRVLIDGYDLRDVTLTSLRRQLGVVPQEPFLFAGSMRDNLAFSRPDASQEDIDEAVDRVGLRELVDRLPHGLDTPVHERGVSLSSGERQLLALGRAFLAQPRVLVLDEATSNLDLKSEGMVEAALDVLLEGRTAIIVAHRLSTAMKADRIVVIDGGGVVESGPHADLVAAGGRYAEMYESWSAHLDGHPAEPASAADAR